MDSLRHNFAKCMRHILFSQARCINFFAKCMRHILFSQARCINFYLIWRVGYGRWWSQ